MKKSFTTVIHEDINGFETIFFSAGKVGFQVEVPVKELSKVVRYTTADVCE
jgi:Cys-tRNA(Pro)/Cys-tRNA(Cys) deacylase